MKSTNYLYKLLVVALLLPLSLFGQDQRTVKTKLTDILAILPASDPKQEVNLFKQLLGLGDEGLVMLTDGVLPNGQVAGVSSRYGVSLLTHSATTKEEKEVIEQAYLVALSKAKESEVKAYFITNLKLVGSNTSIAPLSKYIGDAELFDPAISAIVSIGGDDARQSLASALANQQPATQVKLIKALGRFRYAPALPAITAFATSENVSLKKQALWSMALIADPASYPVLLQQAKSVAFKNDPSESTAALVEFLHQQMAKNNNAVVKEISNTLLAGTTDASQQHFRLAALKGLAQADPAGVTKVLLKEKDLFDSEYQKEVLTIAHASANTPANQKLWMKAYKKSTGASQADILSLLASANSKNEAFTEQTLVPALSSSVPETRVAAARAIASGRSVKFIPALVNYLVQSTDDRDIAAASDALLQLTDKESGSLLTEKMDSAPAKNKVALLQLLAARRTTSHYDQVSKLLSSTDPTVKAAAYEALPNVSAPANIPSLLDKLKNTSNGAEVSFLQAAIVGALNKDSEGLINEAYATQKEKLLPVLPYVSDRGALEKVTTAFSSGSDREKEIAFEALTHWQNSDAIRPLLAIRKDASLKKYHEPAFQSFITQVGKSSWPDDQKLLMLREIMPLADNTKEKVAVIRAAGNVRTFLSLMFVDSYLDDTELSSAASRAAMQIALPTSDAKPGMTGVEVRNTLQHMLDKLTGQDSQYERIDILTYLEQLPYTKGYESIFNGKDLSGWQGLVENPIARSKMTKEVLAKKQKEANEKVKNNWGVKDGMITFQGDGANLCTTRPYGDFEMIVDWKLSKNGDSGIYLRGSPQVQIWDISRVDVGAQVGSGGLYNNQKERSTPLALADNPIGEWNTFYIKMIGDKATVYLNGVLVVDNVTLENYWDRNLPIFPEEAIELQAHGTDLAFRNIYVKELNSKPYTLTKEEAEQGYQVLFNGKDLDNWVGNKTDYVIEDNTIAIYPGKESHGNLYTAKEYSDFTFRFEFQLTPGANNGLGIHAPLDGDAAYVGKEIQILDNPAPVYAKLEVWQFHGSVYGVLPAKREFLKPIGEWNQEEVYVKGDYIRVTLNGTVITEGDLKKASKNGTLDHKDHPGLTRHTGHIGFLGHGSVVKFKNLRILEPSK